MASVCIYLQVHQPFRLRRYSVFDTDRHYFDEHQNADHCRRVAQQCYLPANRVLLETIRKHDGRFRVAFSITGTALEQFRLYAPEVLESFVELANTGAVEFLAETYYHSLAFLYSRDEFRWQVEAHGQAVKDAFGQSPTVFRNTELIYNNDLAQYVAGLGYAGVLAEGADGVLGYRTPNFVYHPPGAQGLRLLLKNYRLSDDLAVRFGNRAWEQWPLTPEKFGRWINQINGNGHVCNLFFPYEALGAQQWSAAETGIFEFLRRLPGAVLEASSENDFQTPGQLVARYEPVGPVDVPHMTSWADDDRDLSVWLGNAMQSNALHELFKLEASVKERGEAQLLTDWRRLGSSDHFYYMCTKYWADGQPQKYQSPYESPYDSYINFMNVLDNVQSRLRA